MRYGVRTSFRAYRIEEDKYSEWQFKVSLNSATEIIKRLAQAFEVSIPTVKFRRMRRTSGNYRPIFRQITLNSSYSTIEASTAIHEFAHHLNYVKNHKSGHDEYFQGELDLAYGKAKELYFGLLERHANEGVEVIQKRRQAELERKEDLETSRLVLKSRFSKGQRVVFRDRNGGQLEAVVERINKKTLTVKDDFGRGWRIGVANPSLKAVE